MFKNKQFHFSVEVSVLAVLAILTFAYLSHWQYTRYLEKKAYFALLEAQKERGRHPLDPQRTDWAEEHHGLVSTRGRFDNARSMVLINRSMGTIPGVKVVTPLLLEGPEAKAVLVDRGFLPYSDLEAGWIEKQPAYTEVQVEGVLRPSQEKTFRFAPPETPVEPGTFKQKWLRLTVGEMAKQLEYPLVPVFLEQTNTGEGYPRYHEYEIISAARHLNYSFQWGGFALFTLFLAVYMQFHKRQPEKAPELNLAQAT